MAQTAAQVSRWDLLNRRRLVKGKTTAPPTSIDAYFIAQTTIDMDYIKVLIERDIDAWRVRSFDNFLLTVNVDAPTTAGPVYAFKNSADTFVGYDIYVFTWRGAKDGKGSDMEKSMKVQMRFDEAIKIYRHGRWSTISDFLNDLEVPREEILPTRRRSLEIQCEWWKANGKAFKLLQLPAEIRDLIYQFGFGLRVEPYPTSKTRKIGGNIAALDAIKARKPTSGLLSVNRQIGAEARHTLYLYTTFFIEHRGIFVRLLGHRPTRLLLRRLELALSHNDFLDIFRNKNQRVRKEIPMAASVIPQLKLSRLELVFQLPSKDLLGVVCQRLAVELILESAWPWIRGQPIKLSGWIKDRQRTIFEARCLVERKKFELWKERNVTVGQPEGSLLQYHDWLQWEELEEDGGVSVTDRPGRAAQEDIEPMEEKLIFPAPCHCDPPCTQETWVAND